LHISTDYVFSGTKGCPYFEEDPTDPINVYGVSKLAGEQFALSYCSSALIIRTSGLYGAAGSREKGGNFVETMVRLSGERDELKGVNDQTLSPTYTRDLAEICIELADSDVVGVRHITNSGFCTWAEWSREIFQLLGRDVKLEEVSLDDFGPIAPRPRFTALESKGLQETLPDWRDALKRYLVEKGHLEAGPS
ncbi:MAG: NAD(P)-dependent oxidoreductase, partial [Planctomycetota bacterium]|nr:NAD(P)-dependent oxidoreductase [Planctomycetota bacterium]